MDRAPTLKAMPESGSLRPAPRRSSNRRLPPETDINPPEVQKSIGLVAA